MLKLAFSDGHTDNIEFNKQRTMLEVTGLDLPHAYQKSSSYTETQKYSVSIMLALGKYLEKIGREDTTRFSAEIIDEAWIFNASPAGRKVLDGIKRLGRSENNMLIYSTQRVGDANDEKSNGGNTARYLPLIALLKESEKIFFNTLACQSLKLIWKCSRI